MMQAADDKGRAEAALAGPKAPASCTSEIKHADLSVGLDPVIALKQERAQVDYATYLRKRCGLDWANAWAELAKITASPGH